MMIDSFPEVRVFSDKKQLAVAAYEYILDIEQRSIQKNDIYRIVMAGGSTPEQIYALLADSHCVWQQWELFLGDERVLPVDDSDRNSLMIKNSLLDHVSIPANQVHFMPTELGMLKAVKKYTALLKETPLPFDLVMLGMGEDGHTASIFPGLDYSDGGMVQSVDQSPKPPAERVTLSADTLSNNKNLLFLVTGKAKHKAIEDWKNGQDIPISRISSLGHSVLFIDEAAWFGI